MKAPTGRAIPGFEEQLEGLEPGGEREFDLELPEAYPNTEAAGKTAHFSLKLLEVKRKELLSLYAHDVKVGQETSDDSSDDSVDRANNSFNRELMFALCE